MSCSYIDGVMSWNTSCDVIDHASLEYSSLFGEVVSEINVDSM